MIDLNPDGMQSSASYLLVYTYMGPSCPHLHSISFHTNVSFATCPRPTKGKVSGESSLGLRYVVLVQKKEAKDLN